MKEKSKEIIIYSTRICPYCAKAKVIFDKLNLEYKEIFVDEDSAVLDSMIVKSGGQRTVPQIFINDHHLGGYENLKKAIEEDTLKKILSTLK